MKGFTEALISDLWLNAPHIKCSVVMPSHIGTSIVTNSRKIQSSTDSDALSPNEVVLTRARVSAAGIDAANISDAEIQVLAAERARSFLEDAPTSAAKAATIILDGVKAEGWRILVGDDGPPPRTSRCVRRRNRPMTPISTCPLPPRSAGGWAEIARAPQMPG